MLHSCFQNTPFSQQIRYFSSLVAVDYNPSRDQTRIKEIALEHLGDLISIPISPPKSKEELFEEIISPALKKPAPYIKVILDFDKVIGFITYFPQENPFEKYGSIEFLAIDASHQGKNCGSLLLKTALDQLKKEGANWAELKITTRRPVPFYQKHGFILERHIVEGRSAGEMICQLNPQRKFSIRFLSSAYRNKTSFIPFAALTLLGILAYSHDKKHSVHDKKYDKK